MNGPARVFVSYSHTSDAHKRKVHRWAAQLTQHSVDVILDDWSLRPGEDLARFTERVVLDRAVSKVLVFSDKAYAERANARRGRVGAEGQIISAEIYAKAPQTKFIPVVCEFEDSGACLPAFLKGRRYIDFSTDAKASAHFGELLDAVFDRGQEPEGNGAEPSAQPTIELEFDLNDSPAVADAAVMNVANYLTYDSEKGLVPAVKIAVRGLSELRRKLAFLRSRPSLSPDEERERRLLFEKVEDLSEEEKQIRRGASFLFTEPALNWVTSLGVADGIASCLKGYLRCLAVVVKPEETARFDVRRSDFPELHVTVPLSEEEVASLKERFQYDDLEAFVFGGHSAADFAPEAIVSKLYPRILFAMSRQQKDYPNAEIAEIFNVNRWRIGLA